MSVDKKDKMIISEQCKEEFLRNLTHELKTPLTIILGYAQLLKEEKYSTEELYLRAINNMERESLRLNSIIDEMIDKAKQS